MVGKIYKYESLLQMAQKVETSDIMHLQQVLNAEQKMAASLLKIDKSVLKIEDQERLDKIVQNHKAVIKTLQQLLNRKYELTDKLGSEDNIFDGPHSTFIPSTFFSYKVPETGAFISFHLVSKDDKALEAYTKLLLKYIREKHSDYVMHLGGHAFGFLYQNAEDGAKAFLEAKQYCDQKIKEKFSEPVVCTHDFIRLPYLEDSPAKFADFSRKSLQMVEKKRCKPGQHQIETLEKEMGSPAGRQPEDESLLSELLEFLSGVVIVISSSTPTANEVARVVGGQHKSFALYEFPAGNTAPAPSESSGSDEDRAKIITCTTSQQIHDLFGFFDKTGVSMNTCIKEIHLDANLLPSYSFLEFTKLFRIEHHYEKTMSSFSDTGRFSDALKKLAQKHHIALSDINIKK